MNESGGSLGVFVIDRSQLCKLPRVPNVFLLKEFSISLHSAEAMEACGTHFETFRYFIHESRRMSRAHVKSTAV